MEPLHFESTEETPEVTLDAGKGTFEVIGKSYPEDATQTFHPVLDWLAVYEKNPNPLTNFVFRLEYFNTATQKLILDILLVLEAMAQKGHKVQITWHYDVEDESMKDTGEEFELLVALPFVLIEDKDDGQEQAEA